MGERLGWVYFNGHLLPRTVDLHFPGHPQPMLFCSAWDETEDSGTGGGAGMWAKGAVLWDHSWTEGWGELPRSSYLCSVTEPQSVARVGRTAQMWVRQTRWDSCSWTRRG